MQPNSSDVQVVNRLRKEHVLDTIRAYGEDYDNLWIFSKIHHEMNQLCSHSTLQDIYIDKFDQVQPAAFLIARLLGCATLQPHVANVNADR